MNLKKFTLKQKELISGIILGDGHLETRTNGKTYRLKIEHGIAQKEYVDYLYDQFKDFCKTPPKERVRISLGKTLVSYGFTTLSSGSWRFYGQQFYKENKKIIPLILSKLLTEQGVAIWFMDDGSYKSPEHKTYIIHANGYTKQELEIVRKVFDEKFGIKVGMHKQYSQWRLCVSAESAASFKKMIQPYVIPSMRYKLG